MITILHLYPKQLNTYGDNGNIIALTKRLAWRNIDYCVIAHNPNDTFNYDPDIIFGGGGQDSNQAIVEDDFKKNAASLKTFIEQGVATLLVCGSYQLIGQFFQTKSGKKIAGTRILDLFTKAGKKRLIGNIVVESSEFGQIVGYENHSGQTYIGGGLKPLGTVIKGFGNNQNDHLEGVRYKNTIGTYCHGPILPKNPRIADFLIKAALNKKGINQPLKKLDDTIENTARKQAAMRDN